MSHARLSALPGEIRVEITKYLPIKDLAALRQTDKDFHNFVSWDFFTQLLQIPRLAPDVVRADDGRFLGRLIDYGLDPNLTYPWGDTILEQAIKTSSLEVLSVLISRGADLSPSGRMPPLHMAAKRWKVSESMMRMLLEGGAPVNAVYMEPGGDRYPGNATALRWVLCTGPRPRSVSIISLLFEYGADLDAGAPKCPLRSGGKWRPAIHRVVKWVERGMWIDAYTATHYLTDLLEVLLVNGANPYDVREDKNELLMLGPVGRSVRLLLRKYRQIWAERAGAPIVKDEYSQAKPTQAGAKAVSGEAAGQQQQREERVEGEINQTLQGSWKNRVTTPHRKRWQV